MNLPKWWTPAIGLTQQPRAGQRLVYRDWDTGAITDRLTVHRLEGNLAWSEYDRHPGVAEPFVWRFAEGLNLLHCPDGEASR
jgi:hypothetical protein